MVLDPVPSAYVSRMDLPKIRTPLQALLDSFELEEAGDTEGAILRLKAANDAAEHSPTTSIPPEH